MKKYVLCLLLFGIELYSIITYSGNISCRLSSFNLRQSYLNPNFSLFDITTESRFHANLSLNFKPVSNLDLTLKLRPHFTVDKYKEIKKIAIDNAYVTFSPFEAFFISIGKMNLIEGVGLSYNPSEFINEEKEMDYTKKDEERKSDREGDICLRIERLLTKFAFGLTCIPQIKGLQDTNSKIQTKFSLTIPNFDFSFNFFYSTFSAFGINISGVITDNLTLHTEIGIKRGSNRRYIREKQKISDDISIYEIYDKPDEEETFVKGLIGGQYIFLNKTNILLEYFYNYDGYSQEDWNKFIEITKTNHHKYLSYSNSTKDIFKLNLSLCNSLMTYRFLRRHYLFLRLWYPDIFNRFDFTCAINMNLEDKSLVLIPTVDYKISEDMILHIGYNIFTGKDEAEFGLVPYDNHFYVELRSFF